jgi:hypothetical protein
MEEELMRRLSAHILRSTLLLLFTLIVTVDVRAQFKAGLQGTVTETAGAVVPGATVNITSLETGRTQTTTTSAEGFYRVSGLPPGRYQVTVEREGFKKKELANVAVGAETIIGIDITIEPGQVSETITIQADSTPALQTENANVNRGITEVEIRRLPQFGRDPYELARLTPGVFGQGARGSSGQAVNLPNTTGPGGSNTSIFQVENQVPISANGQRLSANNFQIDGVSVNSLGWGGAAVVTPNQESVKEVQVTSSSYSAEDGRNSGAQIKIVSQNGTNEFHGSGFFKLNDPALNAFNKYGGPTGNVNINAPPTRVNNRFRQFGGSLGGPIYLPRFGTGGKPYYSGKDRLFFFFSYEGLRERTNNVYDGYVETPEFRQQVLSLRPNSVTAQIFRSAGIEPRIQSVLPADCSAFTTANTCRIVPGGLDLGSLTALPNAFTTVTGGGFDNIPDVLFARFERPTVARGNQFNARIDYTRAKSSFAVSTYLTGRNDESSDSGARSRPQADLRFRPYNSAVTFTYNQTIATTLLNEVRFNITRFAANQVEDSADVNFGIPRVEVEGFTFDRIRFGANRGETVPGIFAQNTFEFRDTLTWVNGNQAWKFGGEIRREQDNNNLAGGARPIYSFTGLFNLANDRPIFEGINADPATGRPIDAQRYFRTGVYSFFAQNDWKFLPNLTLNLGGRYEYFTPLREKRGRISNLVFTPGAFSSSRLEVRDELFEPDRNNFAPRLGAAYSPLWFRDKMVLRAGFGVAFNRIPGVLYLNTRGNPPFFARYSICCASATDPTLGGQILYTLGTSNSLLSYPVNPALATGIDPATGGIINRTVEIYGTPPEMPNAYVYTYSFDAQYELPAQMTATLGYQGSAGHKLIRIVNQNLLYARNPRFAPVFFLLPDINSNYNAMNARLSRRLNRGVQFDAIYRWSKSIDTLSYEGPGAVNNQTNPSDLASERGPSDYDVRHYFVMSALWDLPIFRSRQGIAGKLLGGWQINGIWTANTGFPWTPKLFENIRQPSGETFGPIRPTAYFGGALDDTSDEAFIRVGGNFPGGGARYFNTTVNRDATNAATLALNPPGIGRNSFRGPGYNSIDLSIVKQTTMPGLGENTILDLRFNFFNAFNLLNLQAFGFSSQGVDVRNANFGRAPGALAGRVIEFQARFSF